MSSWALAVLIFISLFYVITARTEVTDPFDRCADQCAPQFTGHDSLGDEWVVGMSGRSVRLNCSFEANPPATVTWLKDGEPFRYRMYEEYFEIGKDYLYLENLMPSDQADYTCQVSNGLGTIERTHSVVVGETKPYAPIIDASLFFSQLNLTVGENVTITCDFESLPAAAFQFMRYNESTDTWDVLQRSLDFEDESLAHNYTIHNFTAADEGEYACQARNMYGTGQLKLELRLHSCAHDFFVKAPTAHRNLAVYVCISAGTLFFLVVVILMFVKMQRLRKKRVTVVHAEKSFIICRVVLDHEPDGECLTPHVEIETETVNLSQLQAGEEERALIEYQLPPDKDWEVTRDQLLIGEKVGEGAFGIVYRACAEGLQTRDEKSTATEVAVKMLKYGHTDSDLKDLVTEMEVMKKVGRHRNIISLLGCVTQDGPPCVVVEFAANGNLKEWLRKHRPIGNNAVNSDGQPHRDSVHITVQKLMDYSCQIAKGMGFLSSKNCIHRDLAARNVLVTADETMKIADFGLARDLVNRNYYRKSNDERRLPVRWMAPEALFKTKYTCQSDVWSFGVVMWELFSFGSDPYPGLNLLSLEPLFAILKSGQRMSQPESCPFEVYALMHRTWAEDPYQRPTFDVLADELGDMLTRFSSAEYLDPSLFAPHPNFSGYVIDMDEQRFVDQIQVYENQTLYTNHAIISSQVGKAKSVLLQSDASDSRPLSRSSTSLRAIHDHNDVLNGIAGGHGSSCSPAADRQGVEFCVVCGDTQSFPWQDSDTAPEKTAEARITGPQSPAAVTDSLPFLCPSQAKI